MKKTLAVLFAAGVGLTSLNVSAGDAEAGKAKAAASCASCHGPEGMSQNDLWPNLKGQKAAYLIKQMQAFRDGERSDPMMAPMVAGLSDEDIKNLAAYYSGL